MRALRLIISFWIAGVLGCNTTENSDSDKRINSMDPFYSDRGGFGTYLRIPLIKPYEAIKVSKEEWRIELQVTKELLELSIHNVTEISVHDSVIFVYAKGGTSIRHIIYDEAWFVIIPSKNLEKGFTEKEQLLSYLKEQNISEPKLYNANNVYEKFRKEQKINWNEDFQ